MRSPSVALKVMLVDSQILTFWSHIGRSHHDAVKYVHLESFKMSFMCEHLFSTFKILYTNMGKPPNQQGSEKSQHFNIWTLSPSYIP